MSGKPVRGLGLAAVIRDTAAEGTGLPEEKGEELSGLKERFREEVSRAADHRRRAEEAGQRLTSAERRIDELRAEVADWEGRCKEAEAGRAEEHYRAGRLDAQLRAESSERDRLSLELAELRRTIDSELPQGEGKRLLGEAMRQQAGVHEKERNLLDAFHLYRRILRLEPRDVNALYRVGTIYYAAGLPERAVEALRGVVEIAPDHAAARTSLAALESELRIAPE